MATIQTTLTLIDEMSSKLNTIRDAVSQVETELNGVGTNGQSNIDGFNWQGFLDKAESAAKSMEKIGKRMTLAITTPLIALGKMMYGGAVDYESAFAGVKKTTDATEEEFAVLYNDLLQMSERNPTGFVDAAGIMEMAGQLGVAKESLTGFTEAYIGLQESTNIQGESGAADLARFLNVTEKTTENVDRVGGVIVGLGNNFATTEQEILSMATRMGATADLAGFSSAEILAFSAALSSVGINAEAGGSAAGKLMKRMQLAAEVGGKAQQTLEEAGFYFQSGLQAQNWLDNLKPKEISDFAYEMGITKDALNDMVSSWVALDQFSDVMGLDQMGFIQSWNEGAAQSMLRFFQGLGNLDPESGNSVLAQLSQMDLTEIRLSNLVAAMSGNSALFAAALDEAYRQYALDPSSNAMAEEVAKRYATQESQNAMLMNKLENTTADYGQNLVDALNPVLEKINGILDAFNKLSEVDQDRIIALMGALAIGGPTLWALGRTATLITKIADAITKIGSGGAAAASAVEGVAAAGGGAAGIGAGATVAGVGALAGVGYVFAKGAEYRAENGQLGSVDAIVNATNQDAALREAFLKHVEAQANLENALNNFTDYSTQDQENIAKQAQAASEAFYAIDGAQKLLDLYNDWRDTNGLSRMDWQLPENLTDLFGSMEGSGADVANGLATGISGNESAATSAATEMGTATIDAANSALGVSSPSVIMIQSGLNTVQGLAIGITTGGAVAIAAISSVANGVVSSANSILNHGAGASIGYNIAAGIAAGIRSGSGLAAAAARALANNVINTLRASMQISSPSRVTYDMGVFTGMGFANGIVAQANKVNKSVTKVADSAKSAWNSAAWSDISLFAGLEHDQLLKDAKDAVKISDADIRKIRDLAEREVINHFTTAEVKVEMHNTNEIKSNMDLDTIVDYLGDKVTERLEACAEGVYS